MLGSVCDYYGSAKATAIASIKNKCAWMLEIPALQLLKKKQYVAKLKKAI
jgi:hypothetical protein